MTKSVEKDIKIVIITLFKKTERVKQTHGIYIYIYFKTKSNFHWKRFTTHTILHKEITEFEDNNRNYTK